MTSSISSKSSVRYDTSPYRPSGFSESSCSPGISPSYPINPRFFHFLKFPELSALCFQIHRISSISSRGCLYVPQSHFNCSNSTTHFHLFLLRSKRPADSVVRRRPHAVCRYLFSLAARLPAALFIFFTASAGAGIVGIYLFFHALLRLPRARHSSLLVAKVTGTNKDESGPKEPKKRMEEKVYPNDPCPCGSGKKYKQCCGRRA